MAAQRIKLWDLPTRLFHWLLVLLVTAAVVSGKIGGDAMMQWHGRIGLGILGLLAFRLVWGFVGSTYARFLSFLPTPGRIAAYLKGQWHGLGHNPLGALSVFGLLAFTAVQVGTGLFSNDQIAFKGPLYRLAGSELSDRLSGIHALSINILLALIALHICAIAFYAHVKKDNLIAPMITGWKKIDPQENPQRPAEPAQGGGAVALIAALLIAAAAIYGGTGAWLSADPPPAPAQQNTQDPAKKFDW